jgi:uncharacterized protein (DUF2062 family)
MTLSLKAPLALAPPVPRKNFWQRRLLEPIGAQLTQGITVEKIALSVAVGSFCAFFPVLGAATPLCLAVGVALRLNQPVVQVINWVTLPLYLPLVCVLVRLGDLCLGTHRPELNPRIMAELLRHDPGQFFQRSGIIAGHAIVGWALLAPLWMGAGYYLSRHLLRATGARFGLNPHRAPRHGQ